MYHALRQVPTTLLSMKSLILTTLVHHYQFSTGVANTVNTHVMHCQYSLC